MASDGHIDQREISIISTLCEKSPLFKNFNFHEEINSLVNKINTRGKEFISYYFDLLDKSSLTEKEELTLIDFAIQTIRADDQIKYSEIKFFKNIRHRLKINDDTILSIYPDIEIFLEEDIKTESFMDQLTSHYLETAELPQFDLISSFDPNLLNDGIKDE